ncbi:methyltransferase domain-containing protein [Rubripirellula reticaptiva]|uniref:Uncharacterized protein n=1 Tax=Rubripirellula reticaptiva TaxID=2528013 RepID=A0A5C6ER49_9BACT|nr:hypothetical protein [Rubripirellula reticaptiva]TWU51105.1 hypothetical protein Poly59_26940 [Rubripirellula reticaptiva]
MLESIVVPANLLTFPLSPDAVRLLRDADERISDFTRRQRPWVENFAVCDFRLVDAALAWIGEADLARGERFCEWGSGFGVVAMLAALRGWDSFGIEVEPVLVDEAQSLAEDHEIEVIFAAGSFIPEGGEDSLQIVDDISHIDMDCPSGYDDLDADVADFDLFFAFPWPGEHAYWEAVFDRYAAEGALLLTYHGIESREVDSLKLQRKVGQIDRIDETN